MENSPCGKLPLLDVVRMYAQNGMTCMAITDHNIRTNLQEIRRLYPNLIFLEGFEYSTTPNFVVCSEKIDTPIPITMESILSNYQDSLRFICHPSPYTDGRVYWSRDAIRNMASLFDGMEIYNGHYGIKRMRDSRYTPDYRATWDNLLSEGCHLWGYANDDFHEIDDFNNAFNMVLVNYLTAANVIQAAKNGSSYISTGLILRSLIFEKDFIQIELNEAAEGRLIGSSGKIILRQEDSSFAYDITNLIEPYIRFEAVSDNKLLCLQPFFYDPATK